MELTGKNKIYSDPVSMQKWEEYEFEFENGIAYSGVGLRQIPYPSIDEIIQIAKAEKEQSLKRKAIQRLSMID